MDVRAFHSRMRIAGWFRMFHPGVLAKLRRIGPRDEKPMTEHIHTNWTGLPCKPCNGTGEIDLDPLCAGACRQPEFCSCPHKCQDCAGTGDEHGEVTADRCEDADCPSKLRP